MRSFPFVNKIKGFFTQGASPQALAVSSAVGLLLGVFPVIGVTTLLMGAISVRWRLNLPLMLALSYLIYPLQIVLLIPFVRLGEWVTGAVPVKLSLASLGASFSKNFVAAMVDLGAANLQALVGWCLVAVPIGVGLHYGILWAIKLVLKRKNQATTE